MIAPSNIVRKQTPVNLDCTGPNGAPAQRVSAVQKLWAEYLEVPIVKIVDLDGSALELILIPPGRFMMGTPLQEVQRGEDETLHRVELTKAFYLSKYPVTQEQWVRVMRGTNPSWFCQAGGGRERVTNVATRRLPVEKVSWALASAFCRRLSTFDFGTQHRFCLPTEAQWEYACRGGTRSPYHFGVALNGHDANCGGNHPYGTAVKGEFLARTSEVGQYASNAFGLHDMHGNVWEWCADWYGPYAAAPQRDPRGPADGVSRVRRGGAWDRTARDCRAATRGRSAAAEPSQPGRPAPSQRIDAVPRGGNLGVRLALVSWGTA